MNKQSARCFFIGSFTGVVLGFATFPAMAVPQIASQLSSSTSVSNVGGGWAYNSEVTPDGRYEVFCSTSENLVPGPGGLAFEDTVPPRMKVFVRDRQQQTTALASLNATGTGGGNGDSFPSGISSNGQFVVFESVATDLFAGNTNTNAIKNVYVRDIVNNITTLVSVSTNGTEGNGDSHDGAITPDGRYVVFASAASNLTPGDTNKIPDIFVRDLTLGVTTLASPGAVAGTKVSPLSPNWSSECPVISADGRYVAFYSTAVGLVSNVTSAGELYVRDLALGKTVWVSANAHAINSSAISANYAMSTNGQWIAYQSTGGTQAGLVFRYNVAAGTSDDIATNGAVAADLDPVSRNIDISADGELVAFTMTNAGGGASSSIQLWNAQTGATTLISGTNSSAYCNFPRLDQSGRYVAFESDDATLTSNSDGNEHVYVRDTSTGNAQLADVGSNGVTPISSIMAPFHFSANGGAVAFDCLDGGLSLNPYKNDAFIRDMLANTTEIISVPAPGMPSLTPLNPSGVTTSSVSSNGQYVAFVSECDGIASIDTNGLPDVYVHDLNSGSNTLVSVSASGLISSGGLSYSPAISGDGRYVAFASSATNLVAGDTNHASDVFLRDLQAETTVLVSRDVTGATFGSGGSLAPQISSDGQRALFFSYATNLTSNPPVTPSAYGGENLYWRDLQAGVTYAVTSNGTVQAAAMSADGSNVVFGNLTGSIYYGYLQFSLWSAQTHSATVLVTSVSAPIVDMAISADGSRGVFETEGASGTFGSCYAVDLLARTNALLGSFRETSQTHSQLSSNGVFLAYIATNATMPSNQVYLYNFTNGTETLVSAAYNSPGGANANCDSPSISADGRYVAYRSTASNLVPGNLNNGADIFLYDSLTGGTTLVSASQLGPRSANGGSRLPFFSADGQTLFFASEASDLTPGDYNEASDVFALSLTTNGLTTGPLNFTGIFVGPDSGQFSTNEPVTLTWSSPSGVEYQIQFKNNLTDPKWQALTNPATVVGGQGSILDLSPNAAQRFYRIVSF